jgi:putative ABC transport system permease protein
MNMLSLSALDLSIAAGLLIALAALSLYLQLALEKSLLIAGARTVVQLLLIGWVLELLFKHVDLRWVLLMSVIMLLAAGREVSARQHQPLKGWWAYTIGISTLFVSSFVITLFSLATMIQVDPWYNPQYAIPLLGMLLGNTMTGIALGMDRLIQSTVQHKAAIEQRLMLGQTHSQALQELVRDATRSALIPTINMMAAAGLVSLPGMMTGQILAGSPPMEAVKYQIMIIFLIAGGTGFGAVLAVQWTARRLFDERHRLRLDRLKAQR